MKEDRKYLHIINRGKAYWIGLWLEQSTKTVTERKIVGRIEVNVRGRRRQKLLLDDLKEKRGYCKLKEET